MTWIEYSLGAMWLSIAILAGGFARTRNRSAWTWFLLVVILGPLGAAMLVIWPARERRAEYVSKS